MAKMRKKSEIMAALSAVNSEMQSKHALRNGLAVRSGPTASESPDWHRGVFEALEFVLGSDHTLLQEILKGEKT